MLISFDVMNNPFPVNSIVERSDHPNTRLRVIGHLGPDMCKVTWMNTPGRFAEMVNVRHLRLIEVLPPGNPAAPTIYDPKTMIRNV